MIWLEYVVLFIFGTFIGSFLNVCIERTKTGESIIKGRSHCDSCKKSLSWYELIPLLSFFIQRGRCRRCQKTLSFQYPLTECATGIGFAILYSYIQSWSVQYILALILFCSLFVLFLTDLKYELISDYAIIITAISAFAFHTVLKGFFGALPYLIVGSVSVLPFLLIWGVTRKKGMGFGDVELAFVLGLLAGYPTVVYGFYLAFLTGAILGVILIIGGKKTLKSHVPFGPFLIGAVIFSMIYSGQISGILKGILW
jgi:prepilin signal peptidase PulO-like enzyme (type II secretory pathway)